MHIEDCSKSGRRRLKQYTLMKSMYHRLLYPWLWGYLSALVRFICDLASFDYYNLLSGAGLPLFGLTVPLPALLSFLIKFAKNADIASLLGFPSSGPPTAAVRLVGVLTPPVPAPLESIRPVFLSCSRSQQPPCSLLGIEVQCH